MDFFHFFIFIYKDKKNYVVKCKNIECNNETEGNKLYCSLKCRNIYVNKYLRDYKKNSKGLSEKFKGSYSDNIKYCLFCGVEIPYDKRRNNYCNSSCFASHTNKNKKGMKYSMSVSGIKSIRESNKKRDYQKKKDYYSNIKKCLNCGKRLPYLNRNNIYCNNQCRYTYINRNKTEYEIYKKDIQFKFNLSDYEDEFDFSLIKKYGWYKAKNRGDNLNGVSRDHMISVKEGYRLKIDPNLLSHPANCELMVHVDNISKLDKSSISLEELKERIEYFDKKYK